MRQARINDWLLEQQEDGLKEIRVISPRTGPGFAWVIPNAHTLHGRLLYALAKELIDKYGVEQDGA